MFQNRKWRRKEKILAGVEADNSTFVVGSWQLHNSSLKSQATLIYIGKLKSSINSIKNLNAPIPRV